MTGINPSMSSNCTVSRVLELVRQDSNWVKCATRTFLVLRFGLDCYISLWFPLDSCISHGFDLDSCISFGFGFDSCISLAFDFDIASDGNTIGIFAKVLKLHTHNGSFLRGSNHTGSTWAREMQDDFDFPEGSWRGRWAPGHDGIMVPRSLGFVSLDHGGDDLTLGLVASYHRRCAGIVCAILWLGDSTGTFTARIGGRAAWHDGLYW